MKPSPNEIYLQPGEYFWGGENNRVKTLLGSCIAICIWHPVLKIGGMSHCLLPSRSHGGLGFGEHKDVREANRSHGRFDSALGQRLADGSSQREGLGFGEHKDVREANRSHGGLGFAALSGKYVDECFEIFFREMQSAGTRKQDYIIKVFGGGNMFELQDASGVTVGERNLQMLQQILARENIRVAAQHVGGKGHRSVIFEIWNGDCWVRHADLIPNFPSTTGRHRS